jgi:hypothetical protein
MLIEESENLAGEVGYASAYRTSDLGKSDSGKKPLIDANETLMNDWPDRLEYSAAP